MNHWIEMEIKSAILTNDSDGILGALAKNILVWNTENINCVVLVKWTLSNNECIKPLMWPRTGNQCKFSAVVYKFLVERSPDVNNFKKKFMYRALFCLTPSSDAGDTKSLLALIRFSFVQLEMIHMQERKTFHLNKSPLSSYDYRVVLGCVYVFAKKAIVMPKNESHSTFDERREERKRMMRKERGAHTISKGKILR